MNWLNYDISTRSQFIEDLLKLIRFQHIDIGFLVNTVQNDSIIKDHAEDYLLKILKQRTENFSNEISITKKTKRNFISDPNGHLYVWKINPYYLENFCKNIRLETYLLLNFN
jgi:hypothetical protein